MRRWVMVAATLCTVHLAAAQRVLTLDECVRIAWGEQPQVAIAERDWRVALERVKSVRANLFPQLSAGYQFRRFLSTRSVFQLGLTRVITEPTDFRETSLSLSQLLFDTFQTPLQIRQARAQANAASFAYERTRADIALRVAQQFFAVLQARAQVQLQRRVLDRARRLLEAAEAGYKAGTAARLDVLRAQVQVRTAEVDLLAAQNQERVAMLTLRNLMGVNDDFAFDIAEPPDETFAPPSLTVLLAQALRQRPEVKQGEWQRASADAAKQLARLQTFPLLTVTGNYSRYPSTTRAIDKEWSLNLIVSYPIFDGGRVRAELEQAQLQAEQAELSLKQTLDTVRLEVQQAYLNWQNARERWSAAQLAVKEASETARLTEEAYRTGAASLLDVLNAQVALAQAETQEIQARYDLRRAVYALRHAVGEIVTYFAARTHR
ncbi:Outer membrane efflux protein BepC [bacterium HR17]|uniref:Outer membrane efflux protein BepC n=1 Tax=Candidatus Fervidibacter japonicus TaxID=2035412 RepID=A0A2H5X939_9BACT|nr:Outer membrane efflux protein BepC [bacterium HR17]